LGDSFDLKLLFNDISHNKNKKLDEFDFHKEHQWNNKKQRKRAHQGEALLHYHTTSFDISLVSKFVHMIEMIGMNFNDS
jgi:hypothetical protein